MSAARRSGRAVDPRDVRTAHVLKDGVPAATLTRVEGGVEFAYTTAYLESGGRAVATTLPLTDAPVRTMAGAVPPYFANLRRLPSSRAASTRSTSATCARRRGSGTPRL